MMHREALRDARRQLQLLAAAESAYLAAHPYRLVHRYDPRAGLYTVRVDVDRPAPDALSALVTSVLRGARTALNELANALASPGGAANAGSAFPIHDSLPQFAQRSRRALAAMPDAAQATIEELQPYHTFGGFRNDALWLLRELDAAGTPRLAAGAVRADATLGVNTSRHVDIIGPLHAIPGPFEHGAVIVSVRAKVDGPDPKLDLFFRPSFELAFVNGEPARGAPLVATLGAICDHVEHTVMARLEPLGR
ncbi:MAG TPA: hypothetical protein VM033_01205 [Gemmatimonadaceae bacterium]|nr:hypothetical protein [Gemmatimonadaceae bacterium]